MPVLNKFQKESLIAIGKSDLSDYFIWSGGTALSYQYLKHRLSLDLDFFSQELVSDDYLLSKIREIKQELRVKDIEEQKRFNRSQYWLRKKNKDLKLEFIFYPFPFIKEPERERFNLKIDSIEDILTNKTHALFERAAPKDVFDIYSILKEKEIEYSKMFKWVKRKFGVDIDPPLFSSRCLEATDGLNRIKPLLLNRKLETEKIAEFFEEKGHDYLQKKIRKE